MLNLIPAHVYDQIHNKYKTSFGRDVIFKLVKKHGTGSVIYKVLYQYYITEDCKTFDRDVKHQNKRNYRNCVFAFEFTNATPFLTKIIMCVFFQSWVDERFQWSPHLYNMTISLYLHVDQIWKPPLYLVNA